jgi:hypothetical protein
MLINITTESPYYFRNATENTDADYCTIVNQNVMITPILVIFGFGFCWELTTTIAFRGKVLFAGSDTTVAFKSFFEVLWSNLIDMFNKTNPFIRCSFFCLIGSLKFQLLVVQTFQKLVYVSTLVFGEASKFLLPWKRVFKVTDAQVSIENALLSIGEIFLH